MTELAQLRLAPVDGFKIAATLCGILAVTSAALVGGMVVPLLTVAVILAFRVYQNPKETIVAGPLFLMLAYVIFPSGARFDYVNVAYEQYYWAAGSFVITLAAFARLGFRPVLEGPRSLQSFLAVAIAASAFGFIHGNEPSYVLRQLYGSLLFGAYFVLALRGIDEESFLRTLRVYGILCALGFMMYYAAVFNELGIHKEITSLGTQAAMLAILFAVRGGWRWCLAAAIMFAVPLLLVARRDLAVFALGIVVMWAFTAKSKLRRGLAWVLAVMLVVVSLAPPYVGMILDAAMGTSVVDEVLPPGARDTSSIEDRGLQLLEAGRILQQSPVFGYGMGAPLGWQSVAKGDMEQAYVDNGWAYVAVKMGIAGILAFGWFLVDLFRRMPGGSVPLSTCLLSMVLLVMFTEPVFFQFTTSPFLGAMAGLLYTKSRVVRLSAPSLLKRLHKSVCPRATSPASEEVLGWHYRQQLWFRSEKRSLVTSVRQLHMSPISRRVVT